MGLRAYKVRSKGVSPPNRATFKGSHIGMYRVERFQKLGVRFWGFPCILGPPLVPPYFGELPSKVRLQRLLYRAIQDCIG